jgi:hypothetical protein
MRAAALPGKVQPKTPFSPENRGDAFWEFPKQEFVPGGLLAVLLIQLKNCLSISYTDKLSNRTTVKASNFGMMESLDIFM